MMEVKHDKCNRCKCWRLPELFLNNKGRKLKTCDKCRGRYECPKCDYKCSTKGVLKIHIKMVHDKIKDFECSKCDYKCSTKGDLNKHIKMVHDKIKDFECSKCDFKCSTKDHLNRHIKRVHDKIKDFECSKCDYKCSTKGALNRHIKMVHDKIKDFECSKCDFKCSTKGHLKIHINTCTGELNCSSGEFTIIQLLDRLELPYLHDESYWGVKDKRLLRWDFVLFPDTNPFVIEYDGKGHFEPIRWSSSITPEDAMITLLNIQRRDKIKNEYCKKHNIPMLRIPYYDFDRIEELVFKFLKKVRHELL